MTVHSSHQLHRSRKIYVEASAFAALVFAIGGFGPNVWLALLSTGVLLLGTILLWRPGEAPILFFTFGLPWLQASMAVFHANWAEIDVNLDTRFNADMRGAIFLSLVGLLALAAGMNRGAGTMRWQEVVRARELALSQPLGRWFRFYVLAAALSVIVLKVADYAPGLSQVVLALSSLKWAPYFLLVYATFVRNSGAKLFFIIAFIVELALGTGGYFSDFRTVFIVTLLAIFAAGLKFSPRMIFIAGLLGSMMIFFGIVWTAVKTEYRDYVAGGHNASQSVNVDYTTRLAKLADLVWAVDGQAFVRGANLLVARVSYVEFFSATLNYVPNYLPHEGGSILLDSLSRPFMPRMFFPDKAIIDDTARTNTYTGGLAGVAETTAATSISLGYIAESYIDFGKFGMMAELFAIGFCYGEISRFFQKLRVSRGLLGMAVSCAVLVNVGSLDNSITKVAGGLAISFLTAWIIVAFIIPAFAGWLVADQPR